jgi:radical SAM-linked protein
VNLTVSNDNSCKGSWEEGAGVSVSTRATAAVRFRIGGLLRFLSHAETSRVFERACARAALPVRYSEGFNPHPKLSLPLPRPVGVQSDDELLVARLTDEGGRQLENPSACAAAMKQALAEQLPDGIEVFAVALTASNASFHPQSAEYVLPIRAGDTDLVARLKDRMAGVMASRVWMVERSAPEGKATRRIDIRPFLLALRLEGASLVVEHAICKAGSIRVDEILPLFELHVQDLAGPVRRTNVKWGTTP